MEQAMEIWIPHSGEIRPSTPSHVEELQFTRRGYNPTAQDVLVVQLILEGLRLHALPHLPTELALHILSLAAYEPRVVHRRTAAWEFCANDFMGPGLTASVAALYLTTPSLPRSCHHATWITMQMRSADQGWADFGGNGTYHNSHTWFEVSILRPVSAEPQERVESTLVETFRNPEDAEQALHEQGWQMVESNGRVTWLVHHNITARREWRNYRVDWEANELIEMRDPPAMGDGEGFLDALRPGDKIALWARAEQIQWVNRVAEAVIEIGYDFR
ncbi:hypothetical protein VP1G_07687 [Cytospora mali]|uniref:Uncharacterized protein n=1 Tax=Cytospora mali TaxID=578113 RepID=A0A194V9K9_CYTMA|nr:hypothetical protein VP1G_07687 [Valsa mali var. pyri (nom. inval.)]